MSITLTYSASSGDCWSDEVSFYAGGTYLRIGGASIALNMNVWAWIPFENIGIPQGFQIDSATVKWTAANSRGPDDAKTYIGCEDATDPATPVSTADISGRTMTTAKTTVNPIEAYTAGTRYSYDITTAVQEVLDRVDWAYGSKLAVYLDNIPNQDYRRDIASVENASYTEPTLEIVVSPYIPSGSWI